MTTIPLEVEMIWSGSNGLYRYDFLRWYYSWYHVAGKGRIWNLKRITATRRWYTGSVTDSKRQQIEQNAWDFDFEGGSNVIDVYIRYLRKKIDAQYEQKLIHTVRGVGYVMRENEWNSWRSRKKLRYGALDCKPSQWNHSRRKYRRYRNEFYFPISENIRGYRYIPFWYIFLILSQYRVILPSVFKPSTKM